MIRRRFVSGALLLIACAGQGWAEDRLQLDETAIKASRELPKILYIVPWKNAHLGALAGGAGSDSFAAEWEVLDRDEFHRQVEYYGLVHPAAVGAGSR
jgi:hypothetical protein